VCNLNTYAEKHASSDWCLMSLGVERWRKRKGTGEAGRGQSRMVERTLGKWACSMNSLLCNWYFYDPVLSESYLEVCQKFQSWKMQTSLIKIWEASKVGSIRGTEVLIRRLALLRGIGCMGNPPEQGIAQCPKLSGQENLWYQRRWTFHLIKACFVAGNQKSQQEENKYFPSLQEL
jgi:hypothetical protein